jgi:hypothetical protein
MNGVVRKHNANFLSPQQYAYKEQNMNTAVDRGRGVAPVVATRE